MIPTAMNRPTPLTIAAPPSQQTIILTLGGFNLAFLGTAAALARRYAASPESR